MTVPVLDRDAHSAGPPPKHSERYVTPPIQYAGLRRVGHEISEEAPDAVAELVLDYIARAA